MQVIRDAFKSPDLPYGAVVTLGNFDGIHRGQRKIIERVVARARELGVQAVLISFDPHPLSVLRPEQAPALLTLDAQREALLREAGIDVWLILRFNQELARMAPEEFVKRFLHRALAIAEIHVGRAFVFGHERKGNVALLETLGAELRFKVGGVEEELLGGQAISATRIRRSLVDGEIELVNELLGRPYALSGKIVRGDRMGQKLGWPTANLAPENKILPADGVYCGRIVFPKMPASFDCVTNVGTRPTVYENYQRVVESHILDFKADLYGQPAEVQFWRRLREEKLFPNVMDLSAQIQRDVETTREFFSSRRRLQVS